MTNTSSPVISVASMTSMVLTGHGTVSIHLGFMILSTILGIMILGMVLTIHGTGIIAPGDLGDHGDLATIALGVTLP